MLNVERELQERNELLDALREKIDSLPHGHERESTINSLFNVHRGIDELLADVEESRQGRPS